ncbi:MAG TPA: hypothetical protein VNO22_05870, partial [Planctomycetota bacterium]|nr:hypothetical protein [Planctomycetota bacterium]
MAERDILAFLKHLGKEAERLDEFLRAGGAGAWDLLHRAARSRPWDFDRRVLERIVARADEAPAGACAVLLEIAALRRSLSRNLLRRCRAIVTARPDGALEVAAEFFRKHPSLLGRGWVADARALLETRPEGAWEIFEIAAAYGSPRLLTARDLQEIERRIDLHPTAYFRTVLSLAANDPSRRDRLLSRALESFERHPAAALEVLPAFARCRELLGPALLEAVGRHFGVAPEKAWEFFSEASLESPGLFDAARLEALAAHAPRAPAAFLSVLHRVASGNPDRRREALEHFVRSLEIWPAEGIEEAYYLAVNEPELLTRPLVDAVCARFGAAAYPAYSLLSAVVDRRPELLAPHHVQAAFANIGQASNWAFAFFRKLARDRLEYASLSVLALFEGLAAEPAHRAAERVEELQALTAVAQASHVRTELERALRRPAGTGSRRARGLLALLFRQRLRSRQHVLFEALRMAATAALWRDRPRTPLWDFLLFLIDHTFDDRGFTAAAERFLEGAFQLAFLMDRPADHEEFRSRFDGLTEEPAAWPAGFEFLGSRPELELRHRAVRALAARFGLELRMRFPPGPEALQAADEREREAIERLLAEA